MTLRQILWTIAAIVLAFFAIITVIGYESTDSQKLNSQKVETQPKTLQIKYVSRSEKNADMHGWEIAKKVWAAAKKHPELESITIDVKITIPGRTMSMPEKPSPRYDIPDQIPTGTIIVSNLNIVRLYSYYEAYTMEYGYWYGTQVGRIMVGSGKGAELPDVLEKFFKQNPDPPKRRGSNENH